MCLSVCGGTVGEGVSIRAGAVETVRELPRHLDNR
jgi:hypothetical protein